MKYKMFAVLDSKAGSFGMPFFEQREESGMRVFADAVNDGSNVNNMWFKHPEDYTLYVIGEYDTDLANVEVYTPRGLVTASAVKAVGRQMELFKSNGEEKEPVPK